MKKPKRNTRCVVVADERAVVTILEALAPLSHESRALVLQTVEVNLKAGYPRVAIRGSFQQPPWREVEV